MPPAMMSMPMRMDDYLSKPIHAKDLLVKIHTLVSLGGLRERADA
jgi:DNA-binding response OmpR family regulator